MSYEPTNWKDGDLVTAKKLNKLEQGVANAGSSGGGVGTMVIHMDDETGVLDKTWQEIYDAVASGTVCVIPIATVVPIVENNLYIISSASISNIGDIEKFIVSAFAVFKYFTTGDVIPDGIVFTVDSADGYPQKVKDSGPM